MRIRTFLGVLTSLGLVVLVSYLTLHNREFLSQPFLLGSSGKTVPLFVLLLGVFTLGFLPPATSLLIGTIKGDLAVRRDRAAQREAESLAASFRRGVDYELDGQPERAAGELRAVVEARPEEFSALLLYGKVLRERGEVSQAVEVHQRLSVLYPANVSPLYQLAEDYEARGEPEVAREIRNRVLREFPGLGLAALYRRRNAALVASELGRALEIDEEIRALRGSAPIGPEEQRLSLGLEYQRAVLDLEQEKVDEAIARFRAVLAREPRFVAAAIMLGEAELLRDDEEAALVRWLDGYEETGSPVFLQRIEDHFIEQEQPRRAIETLRRLIAKAKNDLLPRFFLGRLYYRLEMHEEALKLLQSIEDRVGASPTYHYLLARIYERRGETARAIASYQASASQTGLPESEYRCRACRVIHSEWRDRCDACGAWNSVELDFEEEHLTLAALGVKEAPIAEVPAGWDPGDLPPGRVEPAAH